jgi:transcription termination/antitermination protein NusG
MAEELEKPAEQQETAVEPVAEQGAEQAEAQPAPNERFKWYILHAYSGFERKVKESI